MLASKAFAQVLIVKYRCKNDRMRCHAVGISEPKAHAPNKFDLCSGSGRSAGRAGCSSRATRAFFRVSEASAEFHRSNRPKHAFRTCKLEHARPNAATIRGERCHVAQSTSLHARICRKKSARPVPIGCTNMWFELRTESFLGCQNSEQALKTKARPSGWHSKARNQTG